MTNSNSTNLWIGAWRMRSNNKYTSLPPSDSSNNTGARLMCFIPIGQLSAKHTLCSSPPRFMTPKRAYLFWHPTRYKYIVSYQQHAPYSTFNPYLYYPLELHVIIQTPLQRRHDKRTKRNPILWKRLESGVCAFLRSWSPRVLPCWRDTSNKPALRTFDNLGTFRIFSQTRYTVDMIRITG